MRIWRKRASEDGDVLRVLKRMQKGLAEGKYYTGLISEGYVDGEFRKDVDFEAYSRDPGKPTAKLTLIYNYFRIEYTKEDYNSAVNLDDYPTVVESDKDHVIMIHENDLLMQHGAVVELPASEGDESAPTEIGSDNKEINPDRQRSTDQHLGG